ncbi:TPA: hypothetical protein RMT52_005171 [Escherichia coli]|uniref:hypothetical protein n=1 Tax=Escherichia coli TaxID=562 RepID=UPI00118211D3|nr:hypothetical protein [Escherichia coli]EGO4139132.1 hypothetical protein [Escherichia coli]EHJ6107399.1 hypothetical protein [Escherichia coli]EHL5741402.1 hypothetical protein [Escherichia coli]EHL6435687.1 hypothetical protein [Escherichia coli]EIY3090808.1 hypothetical protein [Escherichia coli]
MMFTPYRRGTILAPSGACPHLHIVCNDPVLYPELQCEGILVVNVSSVPESGALYDSTCVFQGGEHRFIKHPSYVVYARSVIWRVPMLAIRIADGSIQAHDDIDEEFFQPVLDGFLISKYTPYKIRRFVEKYCA